MQRYSQSILPLAEGDRPNAMKGLELAHEDHKMLLFLATEEEFTSDDAGEAMVMAETESFDRDWRIRKRVHQNTYCERESSQLVADCPSPETQSSVP